MYLSIYLSLKPGVARQALDLVHRLQVGGHGAGVRLHLHLREGGRGVVGLGRGGAGHLLDHGLRRREGVELLAAGLRLLLEVGGLGHAVVVQVAEGLDVLPEVLLGDREVALVGGLGLAGLGLVLLGLGTRRKCILTIFTNNCLQSLSH